MIILPNGWVQWDAQVGTYSGVVDGVRHGTHFGHILTPEAFEALASLSLAADDKAALVAERDAAIDDPVYPNPIVQDKMDFIARFTQTEMGAVLAAAKSNIGVEVLVFRLQNAQKIDLRSQVVATAIRALQDASILTPDRVNEVLGLRVSTV
jgi:hypothetical protein